MSLAAADAFFAIFGMRRVSERESMRLLVCGSRNWALYFDGCDETKVRAEAMRASAELRSLSPALIIHGNAAGADSCAATWADVEGLPVEAYPADWKRDGRAAGPLRNARMLAEGKPTHGLAFGALWRRHTGPFDPLFKAVTGAREEWRATGTGDMVRRMIDAGLPVRWVATHDAPAVELTAMPGPEER